MEIDDVNPQITSSNLPIVAMSLDVSATAEQVLDDEEMDPPGCLDLQGCNDLSPTPYKCLASPERLSHTQEHLMATGTQKAIHPDSHLPDLETQALHTTAEETPTHADGMALDATSDDDQVSLGDDECGAALSAAGQFSIHIYILMSSDLSSSSDFQNLTFRNLEQIPTIPYSSASLNFDGAQPLLQKPISTLPPLRAITSTSSGAGPSSLTGHESKMKARRKRGTVKKNHGGHRQALFRKFGVYFWDFLQTMTDEQFASCTPAQQTYITEHKSLQNS